MYVELNDTQFGDIKNIALEAEGRCCFFMPLSRTKQWWDLFQALLLVYTALAIPLYFGASTSCTFKHVAI